MLPWTIRRRSCSGDESTSSIWLALRSTQSGTRSRTGTSMMRSTASAMLSRCWMLTVVITSIPGIQKFHDVLPALVVAARAGDVGVGQLVDQDHLGMTTQSRIQVHLGEVRTPVRDVAGRDHLEVADQLPGALPPVTLDEPDGHVGASLAGDGVPR